MSAMSRRETLGILGAGFSFIRAAPDEASAARPGVSFSLLLVNDTYRIRDENGRGGWSS